MVTSSHANAGGLPSFSSKRIAVKNKIDNCPHFFIKMHEDNTS